MYRSISNYLLSIRLWQWLKNLVVFTLPIGIGTSDVGLLLVVLQSFFGVSFLSSSIYILNDIKDTNSDLMHPVKKNRPIASGSLKIKNAKIFSFFLATVGLISLYLINLNTFIVGLFYFIFGLFYTFKFKYVVYIDSLIISILFLIRVLVGSFAVNIRPSLFLILFITIFSFSLAVSKRISILIDSAISSESNYKKFLIKVYDLDKLKIILKSSLIFSSFVYLSWVINTGYISSYNLPSLFLLCSVATLGRVFYGIYKLTITSGMEDFVLSIIKSQANLLFIILTLLLTFLGIYGS